MPKLLDLSKNLMQEYAKCESTPPQTGFFWRKIMEILRLSDVSEANRTGISPYINMALNRFRREQKLYTTMISDVAESDFIKTQIEKTLTDECRRRTDLDDKLSTAAGVYFFNEDNLGNRESEAVSYTNTLAERIGLRTLQGKVKLGGGVGYIYPPGIYRKLTEEGINTERLIINYNAPGGTLDTRIGINAIVDTKIDPEGKFFPENGVFLINNAASGAIDVFMATVSKLRKNSRVVFLGLSYYQGPYSAVTKELEIERFIADPVLPGNQTRFLPTPDELTKKLPSDTSTIVLTQPNNPNGETYSYEELKKIIQLAKEKNIFIMFDAIFENMYFDEQKNYQSDVLKSANELGALDQIVVADSLSKTKNYAGERVGYIATTNEKFIYELEEIVMAGSCCARLTLEPLIQFEGLARKIKSLRAISPATKLDLILDKVAREAGISEKIAFLEMYTQWDEWGTQALQYYRDNLELTKAILKKSVDAGSPDTAAFNTLVRLNGPRKGTNNLDYLAKLLFTTAIYTQSGPCFGLSQARWDNELGIWPRVTYASSRKDITEGLIRLIAFNNYYVEKDFGNPNKFPVLNISYDKQI